MATSPSRGKEDGPNTSGVNYSATVKKHGLVQRQSHGGGTLSIDLASSSLIYTSSRLCSGLPSLDAGRPPSGRPAIAHVHTLHGHEGRPKHLAKIAITTEPHSRVRSISCPPISISSAHNADLHVLPPTPPSKAAQMIELQPPQSQAYNVLGVKKCWQNIIILSDPDKFNAKTVEHAEREVRLGITKIDHTQLSRESASLILQRLHTKTDHQACQLAAQNLKMEDLSAQVAHWKSTAKQLNDKNKQLKTACDVLAAADKSRAELLQDVQELYEEKKKLQTQFQKADQRLANECEYAAQQLDAVTQKLSAATAQLHQTVSKQKLQEDDFQRDQTRAGSVEGGSAPPRRFGGPGVGLRRAGA
jgi:hypothetical protein